MRKIISCLLVFLSLVQTTLLQVPICLAAEPPPPAANKSSDSFIVQKDETSAKAGSVYVTPTKKNEVLFKASIWGAVQYPGVHYMPLGTRMLDALSLAGGPVERADMENLTLSSHQNGAVKVQSLSLSKALENGENNPALKPEDVLVVREDRSTEKTQLYLQIGTFIFSAVALGLLIDKR